MPGEYPSTRRSAGHRYSSSYPRLSSASFDWGGSAGSGGGSYGLPGLGSTPATVSEYSAQMPATGLVDPDAMMAWGSPDVGGQGIVSKTFLGPDGGLDLNAIGGLVQGIGALGGLYSSLQANSLAKDALNFKKKAYQTNLTNQTQSYNTALENRVRGRYSEREAKDGRIERYLDKHRLEG